MTTAALWAAHAPVPFTSSSSVPCWRAVHRSPRKHACKDVSTIRRDDPWLTRRCSSSVRRPARCRRIQTSPATSSSNRLPPAIRLHRLGPRSPWRTRGVAISDKPATVNITMRVSAIRLLVVSATQIDQPLSRRPTA